MLHELLKTPVNINGLVETCQTNNLKATNNSFNSQSSSYVVSYIGVCEGGDWKCVFCPQLEKVLQQGDIGECAEPYMVFKESDAAKVWSHTATPSYPLHHT